MRSEERRKWRTMKRRLLMNICMVTLAGVGTVAAQEAAAPVPELFAVVNGVRITRKDVDEPVRDQIAKLQQQVIDARKRELGLQINSRLLDAESKRRGVSASKLLEDEVLSKVKDPTEAEARAFFERNRGNLSGEFRELKDSIIQHLKKERENQEAKKLADRLRAAADVKVLVLEATPPASQADRSRVFAMVEGQPVTCDDVEKALMPLVSAVQEQIYTLRNNELQSRISEVLLQQEALARKMTTEALLDEEVSPKIRQITDADAREFYQKNKDRISGEYEQSKTQIAEYLRKTERQKAEVAYAKQLRAKSKIEIHLTSPTSASR